MLRKIDINDLGSLDKIKKLINNLQKKSYQYIFTDNNKMVAVLASPVYFDKFIEKDVNNTVEELQNQNKYKHEIIKFIKDIRDFNKDDDVADIKADIDEAIREVKNAELKKLQLQSE